MSTYSGARVFIILLLALCSVSGYAGPLFLHLVVKDHKGNLQCENISIKVVGGLAGGAVTTDNTGYCRIRLARGVEPGTELELTITHPDDWTFLDPYDCRVRAPQTSNPAKAQRTVIVIKKGVRDLLSNEAFIQNVLSNRTGTLSAEEKITPEMRKKYLKEQAERFGLSADEFEKAISSYLKKTTDPYEKGMNAYLEGNYSEAVSQLMKWQKGPEQKTNKQDTKKTREGLFILGKCLALQGEYSKALDPLMRAHVRDQDYIPCLDLMVHIYITLGAYNSAYDAVSRMYPLIIRTTGEAHADRAFLYLKQAQIFEGIGWTDRAEELYTGAYDIFQKAMGRHHITTTAARIPLAHLYIRTGAYKKGARILRPAELTLNTYAARKPLGLVRLYQGLALIDAAEGKPGQARDMLAESGTILNKYLPAAHPLNSIQQSVQARVLLLSGNTGEGEKRILAALTAMQKTLVPEHLEILACCSELAEFYGKTGQWSKAQNILYRALRGQYRGSGTGGPRTFFLRNKTAEAALRAGNVPAAKILLYKQLESLSVPFRIDRSGMPGTRLADIGKTVNISFEGVRSLEIEDLKDQILQNISVSRTKILSGLVHTYMSALADSAASVYYENGFFKAKVKARKEPADKNIRVIVHEGKRYKIRDVQVKGDSLPDTVKTYSKQKLGDVYTGTYAGFSEADNKKAIERTAALMAEKGYWFPDIKAEFLLSGQASADLLVTVQDPGPIGEIGEIRVKNVTKNSPSRVRKYIREHIRIPDGSFYTEDIRRTIVRGLIDSARFSDIEITPHRPAGGKQWIDIDIKLTEEESIPPLYEHLLPGQKTLLKTAVWLNNLKKHPEDIVSRFQLGPGSRIEMAFSPEKGLAGGIEYSRAGEGGRKLFSGCMLNPEGAGALLSGQNLFWSLEKLPIQYTFGITAYRTKAKPGEKKPEKPNEMRFTVGVDPLKEGEAPLEFNVSIVPAVFLSLLAEENCKVTRSGNTAVYDFGEYCMDVDSETGRIIKITYNNVPILITEKRAFEKLAAKIKRTGDMKQISGFRSNILGPLARELSETVFPALIQSGLIEESGTDLKQWLSSAGILLKLCARTGAQVIKNLTLKSEAESPEGAEEELPPGISVPSTVLERLYAYNQGDFYQRLINKVIGFFLQKTHTWFEWGSWPCMLSHQILLLFPGDPGALGEAVRVIQHEEIGPLGCLAFALLYELKDTPSAACTFALQGLVKTKKEEFLKDCRILLKHDVMPGKIIHLILREAGTLTKKEIDDLLKPIPEAHHAAIRNFITGVRQKGDQPLTYTNLEPVFSEWWDNGLKDILQLALESGVSRSLKRADQHSITSHTRSVRYAAEICYNAGVMNLRNQKYREALTCLEYADILGYPGSHLRTTIRDLRKNLDGDM